MSKALLVISIFLVSLGLTNCTAPKTATQPGSGDICQPLSAKVLDVTLRPQKTDQWCWAASCQMIIKYLQHEVQQCDQANNMFSLSGIDCCVNPTPAPCNNPAWPDFGHYGFSFKRTDSEPLSWDELTQEISCNGSPIAFSWGWTDGGGHMMVARGYSVSPTANIRRVYINDPWAPNVGNQRLMLANIRVGLVQTS